VLFLFNIVSFLTTKSAFALLLSGILTAAQFLLLPRILEQVPAKSGLLIGHGVSTILDLVINGISGLSCIWKHIKTRRRRSRKLL